jgi:hypothetical protein
MSKMLNLTRRHFLWTAGLSIPLAALAGDTGKGDTADEAVAIGKEAYIWGSPLVLTEGYLQLAIDSHVPLNRFTLSTRLSTPADKVAGPNVDTLYGLAWLDLTPAPQILHVPDTNGRYYSIQLIDTYANSFDYVGRRVTGTKEGRFAITGPGWKGELPPGVRRIEAPTNHMLALTRTLVAGEKDLPAAQAVQAQYTLTTLDASSQAPQPLLTTESAIRTFPIRNLQERGPRFFDDLGSALHNDPPPTENAPLNRFAEVGIGPDRRPTQLQSPTVVSALREAVPAAADLIKKADYATRVNGWSVNYKITNFIKDPLLRASVNRLGPGAHVAQEALYFHAVGASDGQPLSGASRYLLRFPPGQLPPADAFWSLILYGPDFYLVENAINRYSIGDRTEGVKTNADGSLDIRIQHEPPKEGISNWLPAPAGGFQLILRTYQPRLALFNGDYKVPPIQRV